MYDNLITSDHLEQVVQKIQNTKASKSTTLSGYGITDSYTKTETDNRIQDIVGAAPEALDTLEEIAEALQDGESTAAGLVQTLSQKADKSTTVTNIAYGSKKLTKTINGSTTDVVTINAIKSDLALTKSDVGLSNVDNTSDANKPVSNATQTVLDTKVDKVSGKGLSTNDYTTTEKNKLSGIASNAQVNIIESIKVNNSVLPISSKSVNITVPTKTSELTNNSNFAVDSNYVHTDNNYTTAEKQKLASKVAELDSNGKVLSSQLPSYVDNVVEYASSANFPTTGESGKIYVDTSANLTYRWTGSTYTEISPSLALGETGSTAYRGDRGKVAYTHATDSNRLTTAKTSGLYKISTTAEGHVASAETATKSDIGLGNVDNTSDLDKPISTATQEALNTKVNVTTSVLKSDEEFTYRQTGDSLDIDAKYGKLKSIKGRTLVWNQLAKNSQSAWAPGMTGSSISFLDGAIRITSNADNISNMCVAQYIDTISGHKYYVRYDVMSHNLTGLYYAGYLVSPTQWLGDVTISGVDKKVTYSNIIDANNDRSRIMFGLYRHGTGEYFSTEDYVEYSNIMFIDLTLMFGAGSEPATPEEFEALYPGQYYGYNQGTLINNGHQSEYDLVWNQIIQPQSLDISTSTTVSSFTANVDGSYTIVLAQTVTEVIYSSAQSNIFQASHKYYIRLNSSNLTYVVGRCSTIGNFTEESQIYTVSSNFTATGSNAGFRISLLTDTPAGTYTIRPWVVDLTQMFGAGNEPATPEEFEAMFPADYYPYDTGTEQHFSFPQFKTKIETVGFNIWDEEWDNCAWSTEGVKVMNSSCIGSSYRIPVLSDTVYYFNIGTVPKIIVGFFLSDGSYSRYSGWTTGTHRTPVGAVSMVFNSYTADAVATYSHDICISLVDTSRTGTYEPYWRSELELGLGDIKVKSHNIWDEEWEKGELDINTGQNSGSNYVRSKNYIPCLPSTAYCINKTVTTNNLRIFQYDSNKQFIQQYAFNSVSSIVLITQPNCSYFRFYVWTDTTYANNVCINESSSFNGRYEPYGDGGVISILGGLKSAGAAYDEISGNKLVKRIGSVDMGTITYTKREGFIAETSYVCFQTQGFDVKVPAINVSCSKYTSVPETRNTLASFDKAIAAWNSSSNTVCFRDDSLSDGDNSNFKAVNTGVILYYELATPIEYELYNPIDLSYKVDKFGTEKLLPESTSGIVSSPFRADIEYRTTNVTIDDVYGGSDIIKSVEDVDSRLTTVEKSINGLVTIGSGSPTTIPKNIGDFYIDVTNKVLYFATGNQLISDWNS